MARRPVIFISATSDLRSSRNLVGTVLYSMGYEPVWQDIEATDGGDLLAILRERIERASMIVQLVGRRYGAEPPTPVVPFGRVSYTQFEALEAERLGKKVIYHVLDDEFPADTIAPEGGESAELQAAYRRRLHETNRLRYDRIATSNDLELSIRRISDELAELRRQAQRRDRHLTRLAVGTVVGIAAIAVVVVFLFHRQERIGTQEAEHATQTQERLDRQSAEMVELRKAMAEVAAAVGPKPQMPGQAQTEPLSPEVLAKAKVLVERGDAEQRALGMIALAEHAEADRIIQELKSKPDNPIDEAYRLLSLEGDNWYQAGEADKAVSPYEKAQTLRPDDPEASNNLSLALLAAQQGDLADNHRRALKLAEQTLGRTTKGETDWVQTQLIVAVANYTLFGEDPSEHLTRAMTAADAVLAVLDRNTRAQEWAIAQIILGTACVSLDGIDSGKLKQGIDAYEAGLTVFTRETQPLLWASVQRVIGDAWSRFPTGDKSANLQRAIQAYDASLTVLTRDLNAAQWAEVQENLGSALLSLTDGDRAANVQRAITAFEAALVVCDKATNPFQWATLELHLGGAWSNMPGDTSKNVQQAIEHFEAAMSVLSKEDDPGIWALAKHSLGFVRASSLDGNRDENLAAAVEDYRSALTVYSKSDNPTEWALAQLNLGTALASLSTGDKKQNLTDAIPAFEAAVTVFTKDDNSMRWLTAENGIAMAHYGLFDLGDGEHLQPAIDAVRAALTLCDAPPFSSSRVQLDVELACFLLCAKDFSAALAVAENDAGQGTTYLPHEMILAHALLLVGRIDEAKSIYLKHVGKRVEGSTNTWEQAVANDFETLEKHGVTSPAMAEIRSLLDQKKN